MTQAELVRRLRGLSQVEVAKRLGISSSNITLLEGEHRRAWPKLRRQLSEIYEVEEGELFFPDGTARPVKMKKRRGGRARA